MKKLTRERVVPTISASVSCEILGISESHLSRLAILGHEQQNPRQPLLAGVEELIDQIGLPALMLRSSRNFKKPAVLMAGEKERPITVRFGADEPEGPPALPPAQPISPGEPRQAGEKASSSGSSRTTALALGALGLAAFTAGAALNLSGYVFVQQCGGTPPAGAAATNAPKSSGASSPATSFSAPV